jgi:hypothetical protein
VATNAKPVSKMAATTIAMIVAVLMFPSSEPDVRPIEIRFGLLGR